VPFQPHHDRVGSDGPTYYENSIILGADASTIAICVRRTAPTSREPMRFENSVLMLLTRGPPSVRSTILAGRQGPTVLRSYCPGEQRQLRAALAEPDVSFIVTTIEAEAHFSRDYD
jgi:hypothetical protein